MAGAGEGLGSPGMYTQPLMARVPAGCVAKADPGDMFESCASRDAWSSSGLAWLDARVLCGAPVVGRVICSEQAPAVHVTGLPLTVSHHGKDQGRHHEGVYVHDDHESGPAIRPHPSVTPSRPLGSLTTYMMSWPL
jgi:hypothetical protein